MTTRILYLIETLAHGGAEHQLVRTVQILDHRRFEPIVVFFRAPDDLAQSLEQSGIQTRNLGVPAGKASWPTLLRRLRATIRELKPALVHTSLLEADVVGGLAASLEQVPALSTLCNIAGERVRLTDNPHNNWWKFTLTNLMWSTALRSLHVHNVAISRAVLDSAASTFGIPRSHMSIIYRGIEPSRRDGDLNDGAKRDAMRGDHSPLLLSIGRLAPQKGHRYLLAAMPQVLSRFPKAHLLVVGQGWLRPSLEQQARDLGIQDQVTFLGSRTDVPELMAACDVFVFPSLFEGLGVALLEAAYAGCACVASDVGPIPEIIKPGVTGLLAPAGDSQTLADRLCELAGDRELRRRLGAAARAKAQAQFMLHDKVKEWEALYDRILGRRQMDITGAALGLSTSRPVAR